MSVIKFAIGVEDSFQVGQLTGYNPTTDPMFGYCFRDCSLWILLAIDFSRPLTRGLFFSGVFSGTFKDKSLLICSPFQKML